MTLLLKKQQEHHHKQQQQQQHQQQHEGCDGASHGRASSFIVRLHQTMQDTHYLYFLQEVVPGGELAGVIDRLVQQQPQHHQPSVEEGVGRGWNGESGRVITLPIEHTKFYSACALMGG